MALSLYLSAPALRQRQTLDAAEHLAQTLGLAIQTDTAFHKRQLSPQHSALVIEPHDTKPFFKLDFFCMLEQGSSTALNLNFDTGSLLYKALPQRAAHLALVRALALKPDQPSMVIDACAGFGRDALIVAAQGAQVTLLERNPVIAALTQNALARAQGNAALEPVYQALFSRMTLLQHNAEDYLASLTDAVDAIYLDPMYPRKDKQAQVKKESQILRMLTADNDPTDTSQSLLKAALNCDTKRVVLKRPQYAPLTQSPKTQGVIAGKTTRYEIFTPNLSEGLTDNS